MQFTQQRSSSSGISMDGDEILDQKQSIEKQERHGLVRWVEEGREKGYNKAERAEQHN